MVLYLSVVGRADLHLVAIQSSNASGHLPQVSIDPNIVCEVAPCIMAVPS
jgi:hypothetical protein